MAANPRGPHSDAVERKVDAAIAAKRSTVKPPGGNLGTFNDEGPTVYPACGECQTPWAFRWCLTMNGSRWLWTRECKHKATQPVLLNRDGTPAEVTT